MIVVDTGPVVALLDAGHAQHHGCRALLAGQVDPPVLPITVFTAVCGHLESRGGHGAEQAFLSDVRAGLFELVQTTPGDLTRIATLIALDPRSGLGVVQASVIAIAERLEVGTVATLDPSTFSFHGRIAPIGPRRGQLP